MTEAQSIAAVTDYDELIAALRDRAAAVGYTNETLDEVTGLQSGYCGKLLGPGMVKCLGPLSMRLMLDALGVELVIRENPETMADVRRRGVIRERAPVMPNRLSTHAIKRYLPVLAREMGRKGGLAAAAKRKAKNASPPILPDAECEPPIRGAPIRVRSRSGGSQHRRSSIRSEA